MLTSTINEGSYSGILRTLIYSMTSEREQFVERVSVCVLMCI